MNFTAEQKQAIETLDRSVLVSAAAGSGKTAILVERILRIILEGRANVDELLVVTFTKAAASEMKLRLASAIRKRMREQPEDIKRLREQLSRLYRAYISTIDSFAMRVIREFFYESDSEPDFKACDEVQGEIMRREALSELFEAGFEDDHFLDVSDDEDVPSEVKDAVNSVGFREFLRLYSEEREEETFRNKLLESYAGLRSIPDYFMWAYDMAGKLRVTAGEFDGSDLQAAMLEDARETFSVICGAADRIRMLFEEAGLTEMYDEKLSSEISLLQEIRDEVDRGDLSRELLERISSLSFITLRAGKDQKEAYESVKAEVKDLRELYKKEIRTWNSKYMVPDLEKRLEEMASTYPYTVYYIRLLEEFEWRYMEKKKERRVIDFADMEHMAVRILRNKDAADIMRRRFRYIFVDEYQDTNRIQETLIGSVAGPDNVFRVGDIKQSIYKFRQAEPEIFRDVYDRFSAEGNDEGVAIDLGRNFRSNDATIRYINRVFGDIMPGYDERARLYTGAQCPPEFDFIPEVHILTTEDMDEAAEGSPGQDGSDETSAADIDDDIISLSKEEAEAEYIAGLVADLIGTEFYDVKEGRSRKAGAGDIVILFRAVRARGDIMSAALRRHNIEPHVEESDDYFDTVEIGVAMALLSCIDNMKRDLPLIATLHSGIFGWTPSELAEIRIAHSEHRRALASSGSGKPYRRAAYWEAFRWYAEKGPEGSIRDKAVSTTGRLLEWRRLSRMMPLDDFIWHVLVDSGFYRLAGAMHGGERRQANLRTLADRAGKYSQETVASLSSYISFVDVMKKKKVKTGQAPAAAGDEVVRISTIHKSKGLEYPFVIIGGLGHRFRTDNNEKSLIFDSSLGLGLPYIDPARKYWRSTMMQRAINAKSRADSYSEELRVLYVAMTRARNKLIMVGTYQSEEKLREYTARPDCYLRAMRNVLKTGLNRYFISPLEDSLTDRRALSSRIPDPDKITLSGEEEELYNEIDRRFSYEYPGSDLLSAKAKYSVSELRRSGLEEDGGRASHFTGRSRKPSKVSAADIGTAYHRIMEFTDFAIAAGADGNVDEDYIMKRAGLLRDNGSISEEVFRELDMGRIAEFFRSDLGRRAARADEEGLLRKEKAFTLRTGGVLVQGVIDCCFEENGKMILVDYKSGYIRQGDGYEQELERLRREYRVQIDLYSEAILKGTGLETGEAYLYLFSSGDTLRMDG